jgi:transcriptional regulator with XRE-family HTH domain
MANNTKKFGEVLREHRKTKNIKLGRLAGTLGMPASNLSDVELGRRPPFSGAHIGHCVIELGLTEAQHDELLKLASQWNEEWVLPMRTGSCAMETGAALMREWPNMTTDVMRQINELVRNNAKPSKE